MRNNDVYILDHFHRLNTKITILGIAGLVCVYILDRKIRKLKDQKGV